MTEVIAKFNDIHVTKWMDEQLNLFAMSNCYTHDLLK